MTVRPAGIRVGILSDTHGHVDEGLLQVLDGCEMILHAGDIGSSRVLHDLGRISGRVVAVLGNNDAPGRWPCGDDGLCASLDETVVVDLPGGRVAMEHGHRIWDTANYHRRLRLRHQGVRAIVYGHTHKRVIDRDGEPWVLNPGAAGRVRTKGGPSCLVLLAAASGWRVSEHVSETLPQRRAG